jgi:hypothetical protein
MGEDTVQRPRHAAQVERFDEQARVADLAAAAAAHEAPKLFLDGPPLPRGLLLERPEGAEVTLSVDDLFHRGSAESADEFLLQVCDAHVETEPLHLGTTELRAEAGSLETAPELVLLRDVVETREPEAKPRRAIVVDEPSDRLRTTHRHDANALGVEVPTAALGQSFERALVADPFDEHDRHGAGLAVDQAVEPSLPGQAAQIVVTRMLELEA